MGGSILSDKNAKCSEIKSLLPTTNLSNSDSLIVDELKNMAKIAKLPSSFPPNGQTPLVHGAKVEIASLCSGKVMIMEQNGALRANFSSVNGRCFVVSQLGSAVMLQCPQTGNFIAANAGYLYGFGANQQQAALRVYYHEDSGAIEFESVADPGCCQLTAADLLLRMAFSDGPFLVQISLQHSSSATPSRQPYFPGSKL
eukprot:sb/3470760/